MTGSIAIVIEGLGGGGAQHVAATLANSWVRRGIDVTIITFQEPGTDVFRIDARAHRIVIGCADESHGMLSAIGKNIQRLLRLRKALRKSNADTCLSFVGSTNVLSILASPGLQCRIVISERNDPARQSLGRAWDLLRWLTYRFADLVVANSRDALSAMKGFVPDHKLLWLPNPLRNPPAEAASISKIPENPYFLAVGRLNAQKAYDVLLSAFSEVHQKLPDHQLVILGEGPLRADLESHAVSLGIGKLVSFAGYVSDPFPWYRAAIALVHPARFEGLPNSVLEAMSQRVAVVVTDAQLGLRGIVKNDESGIVIPAESASSLARWMLSLANSVSLRKKLGDGAFAAVQPFLEHRAIAQWNAALGFRPGEAE